MKSALTLGMGLLVATISQVGFSQAKPPLQNIQAAYQKVMQINNHLNNVVLGGGGGGGGPRQPGQGGGWNPGHGEGEGGGRHGHGGGGGWGSESGPRSFINENDVAAKFAALGMSKLTQELANMVLSLTANYYSPYFFQYHQQTCHKSAKVLIANQGAKVAAALPQVGYILPQFFEAYDVELIQTRQLIMCPF